MKPITGNDTYYITKDGRVWSNKSNKFLKPIKNKDGYIQYKIRDLNRSRYILAHRTVLLTYMYVDDHAELQVNHKDCNKCNNNLDNLEWCTQEQNIRHAIIHGKVLPSLAPSQLNYIDNHLLDRPKDIAQTLNIPIYQVYSRLRKLRENPVRYHNGIKITRINGDREP